MRYTTNRLCKRVELLQVSSVQFMCCEQSFSSAISVAEGVFPRRGGGACPTLHGHCSGAAASLPIRADLGRFLHHREAVSNYWHDAPERFHIDATATSTTRNEFTAYRRVVRRRKIDADRNADVADTHTSCNGQYPRSPLCVGCTSPKVSSKHQLSLTDPRDGTVLQTA